MTATLPLAPNGIFSTIQGEFDKPVTYKANGKTTTGVDLFTTQRPSFAKDDLLATLDTKGVTVNATNPDASRHPASRWGK